MVEPFIPDDCPDYLVHFMTTTSSRLGDVVNPTPIWCIVNRKSWSHVE